MANTPTDKLHPFSLKISPQVPELLYSLEATIAISTYQAGKLIFLSAEDPERLIQLPRTFPKPMGIGLSSDGQKLALAVRDRVIVFHNSRELVKVFTPHNKYKTVSVPYINNILTHTL